MKRTFVGLSFALLLSAAPGAAAQTATTNHEQAALEFLRAIGIEKIVQQISTALANNLIRTNPTLAVHRDVIVEWSSKYVTWEAAAPEMVKAYTVAFSEPELREIIVFYRSPTGQKMASHLPELMESAAAAGGRLAGAHIADLERMLKERIERQTKDSLPPKTP
jgi:hypothetical protein